MYPKVETGKAVWAQDHQSVPGVQADLRLHLPKQVLGGNHRGERKTAHRLQGWFQFALIDPLYLSNTGKCLPNAQWPQTTEDEYNAQSISLGSPASLSVLRCFVQKLSAPCYSSDQSFLQKNLGQKECKYFNKGVGECPFGNKCFYQHADKDGRSAVFILHTFLLL